MHSLRQQTAARGFRETHTAEGHRHQGLLDFSHEAEAVPLVSHGR